VEIRYQSVMPDYASILKRSIETLPEKTPDMRQAVYERARAALARQLTSVDPPLGPESIELQHRHLEDAISVVETDFSPSPADADKAPEDAAGNGEIPGDTALAGDEYPADLPAAEGEPSPSQGPDQSGPGESEPQAKERLERLSSGKRWEQPKASHAPAMIMLVLFALIALGAAIFAYTQWETVQAFIEDFGGETTVADGTASGDGAAPEIAGGGETVDAPKAEDRLLDGVAAPLDGAQALPSQVAEALDTTPVDGGPNRTAAETATESPGETMQPAPGVPGGTQAMVSETPAAETPTAEAPVAETLAAETPVVEAPAAAETAVSETPASETPAAELPAPEAPTGTETVDAVPQGLVGQRAIFEEQGAEGAPGKSVPGVVAWSQKDLENGLPAIVGVIDLPDRKAAVSLTITKNADAALPASHLIEIEFRGADGLVGSQLERVPALFMKQQAQTRGNRLTGEAVPVTENLYWIALSDQDDQVARNLMLLRDGAWFGLPMLFKNGRGGLLNFEKGIPGDQVFEAVLAAWDKAGAGQ
jgi:hypothetical protein